MLVRAQGVAARRVRGLVACALLAGWCGAAAAQQGQAAAGPWHVTLGFGGVGRVALAGPNGVTSTLSSGERDDGFGYAVAAVGDLDRDGVGEIAVSAPRAELAYGSPGVVHVYSGASGVELFTLRGLAGDRFGFEVEAAGDLDQDGTPDIWVGGMALDPRGVPVERRFLFSGRTGSMLFDQAYPIPGVTEPVVVASWAWGDVDRSGVVDSNDLTEVTRQWALGPDATVSGDLTGDWIVDDRDFEVMSDILVAGVDGAPARPLDASQRRALAGAMSRWGELYPEDPAGVVVNGGGWPRESNAGYFSWWKPDGGFALTPDGQRLRSSLLSTGLSVGGRACKVVVRPFGGGGSSDGRAQGIASECCEAFMSIVDYSPKPVYTGDTVRCEVNQFTSNCTRYEWYYWRDTYRFGPFGGPVLEFTAGTIEGAQRHLVEVTCYNEPPEDCKTTQHLSIPIDQCQLAVAGMPGGTRGEESGTITAHGTPPGGTYVWRVLSGGECLAAFTAAGPAFSYTTNPRATGFITIEVEYINGLKCKDTKRLCMWSHKGDTDGDGLDDDMEVPGGCPDPLKADSDGDGLPDGWEYGHTDPCQWDTDRDGAGDGCELVLWWDPLTPDDTTMDSDHDEIPDIHEPAMCGGPGTDPRRADTDGDGVLDGCEVRFGWDPLDVRSPGTTDRDGDGLADVQEQSCLSGGCQTNPDVADTDGDGLKDGEEGYATYTSPCNPDMDGDGIPDGVEIKTFHTSPLRVDTDGDGMTDMWEITQGLNPTAKNPPDMDTDGDGLSDRLEFSWGTNPRDPDTDHDGVADGQEVDQRSDPVSALSSNPDDPNLVDVTLSISGSGQWGLSVGGKSVAMPEKGQSASVTVRMARGECYDAGVAGDGTVEGTCPTRYDHRYCASVSVGGGVPSIIIDEGQGPRDTCGGGTLLGCHASSTSCNPAAGKSATVCLPLADVDVDSRSQLGFEPPDGSPEEEKEEDRGGSPGKIVFWNRGDIDNDGIPDYADGFDLLTGGTGTTDDDELKDAKFIPVKVKVSGLPAPQDPQSDTRRVEINYNDSNPRSLRYDARTGYRLPPGKLRLWAKDASARRDPRSITQSGQGWRGDYIAPGQYAVSELFGGGDSATWYAEVLDASAAPGDLTISVRAYDESRGGASEDEARITGLGHRWIDLNPPVSAAQDGPVSTKLDEIPISAPTPLITLSGQGVSLLRVYPDPQDPSLLRADLGFSGEIKDAASNLIEGPTGTIAAVQAVVNASGETYTRSVNVQVQKASRRGLDPSNPFNFRGTFSTGSLQDGMLRGVPVAQGWNTLTVRATNTYGLTGFASVSFEVAAMPLSRLAGEGVGQFRVEDYSKYSVTFGETSPVTASKGGVFRPVLDELVGPREVISDLNQITIGGRGGYTPADFQGSMTVGKVDTGVLGTAQPQAFLALVKRNPRDPLGLEERFGPSDQDELKEYVKGLGAGFCETGIDIWEGAQQVGEAAWHILKNYNAVALAYRLVKEGSLITAEDARRLRAAAGIVERVAEITYKLVRDGMDAHAAVMTGDEESLSELGHEYGEYFRLAAGFIEEMRVEFLTMKPFDQGKVVGGVVSQFMLAVIPTGGAGLAASEMLLKMLPKVRALRAITESGEHAAALARAIDRVAEGAEYVKKTKICFPAGTPVATPRGAVPIESLRVGDMVVSRGEGGFDRGVRPVLATFVTHPSRLRHVRYLGLDGGEHEMAGTGEHPFYVAAGPSRTVGGFVPAGELEIGDRLSLIDGTPAWVTDLAWEEAAGGAFFTTYNIEVAEFHTYFAGEGGVWVHNHGREPCEKIADIYHKTKNRIEGPALPAWEAAQKTLKTIDTVNDKRFDGGVLTAFLHDAMREAYEEALGTTPPNFDRIPTHKQLEKLLEDRGIRKLEIEKHHLVPYETFAKKLCELYQRPYDEVFFRNQMPAMPLPRCLHNRNGIPGMPTVHRYLDEIVPDVAQVTDPRVLMDAMRLSYQRMNQQYGEATGFDYNRLWQIGEAWLKKEGIPPSP